jgi:hypothetical protein
MAFLPLLAIAYARNSKRIPYPCAYVLQKQAFASTLTQNETSLCPLRLTENSRRRVIFYWINTVLQTSGLPMLDQVSSTLSKSLDSPETITELTERLDSPDADIIVVPRPFDLEIAELVQSVSIGEERIKLTCARAESIVSQHLNKMRLESPALLSDIVSAVELFSQMFDQRQVELRMEVTDQQACPKFHCDNVYVRMLITYAGPTTEYIDRFRPDEIQRAPLGGLVFLKGHRHPAYQDQMLHRSPPVPNGQKRFSIVVNLLGWLQTD